MFAASDEIVGLARLVILLLDISIPPTLVRLFPPMLMLPDIVPPDLDNRLAIELLTNPRLAASLSLVGDVTLIILWLDMSNVPLNGTDPSNGKNPGPILSNVKIEPTAFIPSLRLIYPTTADCVGTASIASSAIVSSALNDEIATPRLNPKPSRLVNTMLEANLTIPVPWSTLKNGPTLKLPS